MGAKLWAQSNRKSDSCHEGLLEQWVNYWCGVPKENGIGFGTGVRSIVFLKLLREARLRPLGCGAAIFA